jgi:hypothetical protein
MFKWISKFFASTSKVEEPVAPYKMEAPVPEVKLAGPAITKVIKTPAAVPVKRKTKGIKTPVAVPVSTPPVKRSVVTKPKAVKKS